jgi:tetratricopeptide (TPR) repeat protein
VWQRSEALSRALVFTAAHASETQRAALLQQAALADPAAAEPHLRSARLALARHDVAAACSALGDAVHAMQRNPVERARWMQRGVRTVHGVLGATLATLAALWLLRVLLLARHAIGARLGSPVAASLLVLVPVLAALAVSVALATLVMLVVAASFMRRRERVGVAALCLLLAVVELSMTRLAPHAVLLDPRTETARIARLGDGGGAFPDVVAGLAATPQRSAAAELALGLQARRRGDLEAARRHDIACLRADSTCVGAYVNLANLFFHAGEFERAATGYRTAQALAPGEPLPHFDLAQTYLRLLHYSEADAEMRAAADRGMPALTEQLALWRDDTRPVLDMTLSPAVLLDLARAELRRTPGLRDSVLVAWKSGPWRTVRPGIAVWLLAGIAMLLASKLRLHSLAALCPGCGTVLCAHCAQQPPVEGLCNACLLARPRGGPRVVMPEDEAAPTPRRRVSVASGRWVAALFPGGADVARGASFAALCTTLAAWTALFACVAVVDAARLRGTPWMAWLDGGVFRLTALLFLATWLPGLWRAQHERSAVLVRPAAGTPGPGLASAPGYPEV